MWTKVKDRLPPGVYGDGGGHYVSEDVLAFFDDGGDFSYAVVNYDHEVRRWSIPAAGFMHPGAAPTHWMPLPATPGRSSNFGTSGDVELVAKTNLRFTR